MVSEFFGKGTGAGSAEAPELSYGLPMGTESGSAEPASAFRVKLEPSIVDSNRRALLLLSIRDAGDRAPLAQEIFDEIAIAIVEGRLRPGDDLNSVDLARRFGTSRTPVREALAALERQGVVVVPPRRRPYIARLTLKKIKDVYDLRASLNTLVSELIIEHAPKDGLRELWQWYDALEQDVAENKVDEYFWHNVGFRLVEARIAGNEELHKILASFGLRTLQFRHMSLSLPGRLQRSLEDHRRLLTAYDEGDTLTAIAATRSLILMGYRAIELSGQVPIDLQNREEEI